MGYVRKFEKKYKTYEGTLNEMATIGIDKKSTIRLYQLNPDTSRVGNPYFKIYDTLNWRKATHVARILFKEPIRVIHKGRQQELELTTKDLRSILCEEGYFGIDGLE